MPTRREFLKSSASGLSMAAFGGAWPSPLLRALADESLTPRAPHFPARSKRLIFLFMHGGPSQVDTFDHKPLLDRDHGKPLPFAKPRVQFAETGNLLKSPWPFAQHGDCGAWVSSLFPHVARVVDRLCFVKSLHGTNEAHGGALLKLHTGSDTFVRPSLGSWITYGLGSENQSLPGFITLCPTLGHGGVNNWSSAFLPAAYQGTPLGNASVPASQAVFRHLTQGEIAPDLRALQLRTLAELEATYRRSHGDEDVFHARSASFALAERMQAEAPRLMDLAGESQATLDLYGITRKKTENFGRQCLLARRLVESGVRVVQCSHSYKWDQHAGLKADHESNALEVDQPIAALVTDLQARGLLEDTLVLWAGEFGRTPTAQGADGRDHNPHGFTVWMAGGGIRAGLSYGATDDYGFYAAQDKVHVHDLHATLLHLMGLDHERLTFRYAGRDFRLTDVHGRVVDAILAPLRG